MRSGRILTSAAAIAALAAAAFAPSAAAATSATGTAGSTAGITPATGHRPLTSSVTNLHAQFERMRGHVAMGPRAGIVKPVPKASGRKSGDKAANGKAQPCTEPNCNLVYNGGPVQHSPQVWVVFWGPNWQSDANQTAVGNYLLGFYSGLGAGGDTWSQTTSPYSDSTGGPRFTTGVLTGYGVDTSTPPAEVTPSDIATEAVAAANAFGITDVPDAQVVVASQSGTCFSDGFAGSSCQPVQSSYCGWHSSTSLGSDQLSYTNLPYELDAGGACGENFINAGSAGTLDGVSIVGGHEFAESVTDPAPNSGYIDLSDNISGGEIADKCAWGGQLWGSSDPSGNVTLKTGTYAMQSLWSNQANGCVMSTAVPPVFSAGSPPVSATAGTAYSYSFATTGNPLPTFALASGTLPPGLSLNATTGKLSGTPTVSGPFTFTIRATNGDPPDALTAPITVTVSPGPLDHLQLSPATATVQAGTAESYRTTAFDFYGNSLGDVTAATSLTITPNGTGTGAACNNGTHNCTAAQFGPYTVAGTDAGKTGKATLTIGPRFSLRSSAATDVSVAANGSVFMVSTTPTAGGKTIDHWNGARWTSFPGGAVTIAVDPAGNPWVINSAHQIFRWTSRGWVGVTGAATDIAIGANGSVFRVGTSRVPGGYAIYRWTGSAWAPFSGGAVTIAVDPAGNPWVVNSAHQIFRWTSRGWVGVTGTATDIAIGANGSVWRIGTNAVSASYGIYDWTGGSWAEVLGGAVTVAVAPNGHPWVINSGHQIFSS